MAASKLKAVDAVIVGAGVAGTIIAKELAQAGLSVVALYAVLTQEPAPRAACPPNSSRW